MLCSGERPRGWLCVHWEWRKCDFQAEQKALTQHNGAVLLSTQLANHSPTNCCHCVGIKVTTFTL